MNRALQVAGLMALSTGILMSQTSRQVVPTDVPLPFSAAVRAGDLVYVGGELATLPDDGMAIVPGGIQAQTRRVMERLSATLAKAGSSLANAASVTVYLRNASDFQAMNAVYRDLSSRRAITTPAADGRPGQANPVLSSAIQVGNRLYLSGMLGDTAATAGDAGAQTREALARLGRTLAAAGFDWSHVVDGVVYLPDLSHYGAMNEAYRAVFPKDFPARAAVRAGLVAPGGLVEIMLTAVKQALMAT
ncbi:MAG: RidA family protein [Acidobacteria bacterium]|nr:RidA family protein [Acidobacteriota bacterium]